jgi:hypothetical protein
MPKVSSPLQWNSEFGAEEPQDWIGFCGDELDRKPKLNNIGQNSRKSGIHK